MNKVKNIVLCGFMGAGKSTTGAELSRRLNMPYIDMDTYIERREKIPIAEIFKLYGEEDFRRREHEAAAELSKLTGTVISAGGGTMTRRENVDVFSQSSVIVFLRLDFNTCYSRIRYTDKPLVTSNTREELMQIYNARQPLYNAACSFSVDSSGGSFETANAIIKVLNREKPASS